MTIAKNKKKFTDPSYYANRELSWLDFNDRCLDEARNPDEPLLERANFLGITQSNVDEFYMVRVASLSKLVAAGVKSHDASGLTPLEQLTAINHKEHEVVEKRYSTYSRSLLPLLRKNGINILESDELSEDRYRRSRRQLAVVPAHQRHN